MGAVDMTQEQRIGVLLVDDEAIMRAGLRLMLDGYRGIAVIGEAADGRTAVEQSRALGPDVVLMDIRMPTMNGLEALAEIMRLASAPRVVMLTAFDTDDFVLDAMRGGAVSFLLKDAPPEEVVAAVLGAIDDQPRFSPSVLARLVRLAAERTSGNAPLASPSAESEPPSGVTQREWEVGLLVAEGLGNQDIGERLAMSLATVKTHLSRLFDKLQVSNRVQLAIKVLEHESATH